MKLIKSFQYPALRASLQKTSKNISHRQSLKNKKETQQKWSQLTLQLFLEAQTQSEVTEGMMTLPVFKRTGIILDINFRPKQEEMQESTMHFLTPDHAAVDSATSPAFPPSLVPLQKGDSTRGTNSSCSCCLAARPDTRTSIAPACVWWEGGNLFGSS